MKSTRAAGVSSEFLRDLDAVQEHNKRFMKTLSPAELWALKRRLATGVMPTREQAPRNVLIADNAYLGALKRHIRATGQLPAGFATSHARPREHRPAETRRTSSSSRSSSDPPSADSDGPGEHAAATFTGVVAR